MSRPINKIRSDIYDKEQELIRCEEDVLEMRKLLRSSVSALPLLDKAVITRSGVESDLRKLRLELKKEQEAIANHVMYDCFED